ncbi:Alcohol dehydrogenase transcription factor Myb/SANT-like [Popillia japonica]|uniref:Alcohol dehydrogenase transcription factor Myb/SANT-like n=1 Tax=Popillia japonica TaxID=7064 RepID=A0AAW1IDL1_POPJA
MSPVAKYLKKTNNYLPIKLKLFIYLFLTGKTAKEHWRKLRECHREAIRRQEKKSGQQATTIRPWTYHKQMNFLKPFMKNRITVGYSNTFVLGENHLEDSATLKANHNETDELTENATPKKIKKSTISDHIMRKYIEDCDKKSKMRDELRHKLELQTQKEAGLQTDALHNFLCLCII